MTLAMAFGLDLVYLVAGAAIFGWALRRVRAMGRLARPGMD
jgi:hypothetical protein